MVNSEAFRSALRNLRNRPRAAFMRRALAIVGHPGCQRYAPSAPPPADQKLGSVPDLSSEVGNRNRGESTGASGVGRRTFWLSTAASYQVKLRSGLDAKRPSTRSNCVRLRSLYKKMYLSLPFTSASTLMS